jgi:hypothetical protein
LQYNPAGLSLLQSKEAHFMYLKGLEDQNVEYLAFGSPLPFSGLIGSGHSTLAGSLLLSQNGSIQVNTTNPDGSLAGSQTLSAGGDVVATVGYAEKVADTAFERVQRSFEIQHFLGATGKFVYSSLARQYSASAWATDLGYLARFPGSGWSAGASLLNLGTKMTFIQEGDPLPLTFRVGGAYKIDKLRIQSFQGNSLTLAADLDYSVYARQWHVNSGLEYIVNEMFRARLGYQFHQDIASLTAGLGFQYQDMTIDYAWAMNTALTDTHRIGLTYRFGQVSPRARARTRQARPVEIPQPQNLKELEPQRPQTYDLPKRPRGGPRSFEEDNLPVWIY